jgi:hypothetical protein
MIFVDISWILRYYDVLKCFFKNLNLNPKVNALKKK